MSTRRNFLGGVLGGVAGAGAAARDLLAVDRPAWPGPIGLEIYTVRDQFAKDPAGTLKQVAAVGYKEVEIGPGTDPAAVKAQVGAVGLTVPSSYLDVPKSLDDWKKSIEACKILGVRYLVVGDNPAIGADEWKQRADLFNQCGKASQAAGIQFCYHAHFREFARIDNTSGYEIMLTRCDPKLLKFEMDVFWASYAGVDPVVYFERYPGRFPLLHIKDLKKGYPTSTKDDPPDNGPNPFMAVGQGRIDWKRIFAHSGKAGAKHIFVEQDRCDAPPLDSIKISFDYLRKLRVA